MTRPAPARILVLPGDGIGPEVVGVAVSVLEAVAAREHLSIELAHGIVGGAAIDATGSPLPPVHRLIVALSPSGEPPRPSGGTKNPIKSPLDASIGTTPPPGGTVIVWKMAPTPPSGPSATPTC